MKPREYQIRVAEEINGIYQKYQNDKRAFVHMPTGTGKTYTAMLSLLTIKKYINNYVPKEKRSGFKVIWIAHRLFLNEQTSKSILKELAGQVEFMCWQSFTKEVQRTSLVEGEVDTLKINVKKYDMLVIDECHVGSSNASNSDDLVHARKHKAFQRIIKKGNIPMHLYVSATPYDLNPEVYPGLLDDNKYPLKNRTATYTMKEAKQDDIISNVNILSMMTADTVILKHMDKESEAEVLITSKSKKNQIKDLAEGLKRNKVDLKDIRTKRNLQKNVLEGALGLYINTEVKLDRIPPTIFFCSSIDKKDDPFSLTNVKKELAKGLRAAGIKSGGKDVLDFIHSGTVDGRKIDTDAVLRNFKNGTPKILLTVDMCKEAYDYPELEVIVDLAPNFNNARSTTQKLGRLFRKPKNGGEKTGRYYYPDTVYNYINSNIRKFNIDDSVIQTIKEEQVEKIIKNETDEVKNNVAEFIVNQMTGAQNLTVAENKGDVSVLNNKDISSSLTKEIVSFANKKQEVYLATNGFVVKEVKNSRNVVTVSIKNIFDIIDNKDGIDFSYASMSILKQISPMLERASV